MRFSAFSLSFIVLWRVGVARQKHQGQAQRHRTQVYDVGVRTISKHQSEASNIDTSGRTDYEADLSDSQVPGGLIRSVSRQKTSFAQQPSGNDHELGPKYLGYCVDKDGNSVTKMRYFEASENECWARCEREPTANGCAYHWNQRKCVEYFGASSKPNGQDGFTCRIKKKYLQYVENGGGHSMPTGPKPECAATCPDSVVPTCSMYKTFTSVGGCAHSCNTSTKMDYQAYVCGRKPLCAATCPEVATLTCDTLREWIAVGGCAASCPIETRTKFKSEVCGINKPACAQTCPDESVPTCSMFKTFTSEGGCAHSCNSSMKLDYQAYVCAAKPLCAASCGEGDEAPTCKDVDAMIGPGGCAATCPEETQLHFRTELCGVKKPPCADACPDGPALTCSIYKNYISDGGCANDCSDVSKAHYQSYLCGRKPLCAAHCPDSPTPTCDMYDGMVGEGGCAASCSDATKYLFKNEVCNMTKPDCAATCPDDAVPTCSMYKTFISEGGCASTCTDAVKDHYKYYVCGRKPLCAAHCPEDAELTCDKYEPFVGTGGCAESCTDFQKAEFQRELCTPNDVRTTYASRIPDCAETCQFKYVPTCALWKRFTAPGNCASSCTPYVKGQYSALICGDDGGAFGYGLPMPKGAPETYPNTFAKAEKEAKKIEIIIQGAEAEAALPDTTHTWPPSQREDDEEEEKSRMKTGLGLMLLTCCWCGACYYCHHRALFSKKQKGKLFDGGDAGDGDEGEADEGNTENW